MNLETPRPYASLDYTPEVERAIMEFTGLVATAIANADARAELSRLADEQAALRRVATLVAEEESPRDVFAKVRKDLNSQDL